MEIKWPSISLPTLSPGLLKTLNAGQGAQPGQIIDALVSSVRQKEGGFELLLQLQLPQLKQSIKLISELPLAPGTRVQLKAMDAQRLQLIPPSVAADTPEVTAQSLVTDGLREALPSTKPLLEAFSKLAAMLPREALSLPDLPHAIPTTVQTAIKEVLQKLPSEGDVSTESGVKKALLTSGIALEQHLSSGDSELIEADLKASMQRAIANVLASLTGTLTPLPTTSTQQTPLPTLGALLSLASHNFSARHDNGSEQGIDVVDPQLKAVIQELASAIGNTQLRQLTPHTTSPPDVGMTTVMSVELPIKGEHGLQPMKLTVDRENEQQERPTLERAWVLNMQIELTRLGAMHARIFFRGHRLSATLWAQQPVLLKLLEDNSVRLRQRLSDAGVDVASLDCKPGLPANTQARLITQLVDIRT